MAKLKGRFCQEIVKPEIWPLLDPADPISFNTVTANGVDSEGFVRSTTSTLTLNFNKNIDGLTESNITLTNLTANMESDGSTTDVVKGRLDPDLNKVGIYTLEVSGITGSGTIVVSVSVQGVTISNDTHRVMVYRANEQDTMRLALLTDSLGNITLSVPGPLFIKPFPLLGVWQWIDPIDNGATVSNMYARIKFYELNGVTEVYYCPKAPVRNALSPDADADGYEFLGTSTDINPYEKNQWGQIRTFIELANKAGIKTSILISDNGDSTWVTSTTPYANFDTFAANYAAYQSSIDTKSDQRFSGLHLDFETYSPFGDNNPVAVTTALQNLTNFLTHVRSTYGNVFKTIDLDVSCWIGNHYTVICNNSPMTFAKAAFNKVDRIFTMGFYKRGDETYNKPFLDGWLDVSNNPDNKPVIFGAETKELDNSPDATYFGSGKIALNNEMDALKTIVPMIRMDISRTGLSFDTYGDSWMNLVTDASMEPDSLLLPASNTLLYMLNTTLNNKTMSLSGFGSAGLAAQLPVNSEGYYYFYAEFNVSNPGLPGVSFFTIYIESGPAGAYYAGGEVDYYDANWSIKNVLNWWDNLPSSFAIPDGSLPYYTESNYPQAVLDTLILS